MHSNKHNCYCARGLTIVAALWLGLGCDPSGDERLEEAYESDDDALHPAEVLPEDPELQAENSPVFASDVDRLNSCEWYKDNTSTEQYLYVQCPSYQKPISGGCYNSSKSAPLSANHPFEHGAINFPEDNEPWFFTDGATGWRCEKDGTAGTLRGGVLCCGNIPAG